MAVKTTSTGQTRQIAGDIVRPRLFLHVEGAAALALTPLLYWQYGGSWLLFVILFLAFDLSMLGFLAGPRVGALSYNLAHTYAAPAILAALGIGLDSELAISVAIIWLGHIGMDRMLGYGLKYSTGFKDTHLGHV